MAFFLWHCLLRLSLSNFIQLIRFESRRSFINWVQLLSYIICIASSNKVYGLGQTVCLLRQPFQDDKNSSILFFYHKHKRTIVIMAKPHQLKSTNTHNGNIFRQLCQFIFPLNEMFCTWTCFAELNRKRYTIILASSPTFQVFIIKREKTKFNSIFFSLSFKEFHRIWAIVIKKHST